MLSINEQLSDVICNLINSYTSSPQFPSEECVNNNFNHYIKASSTTITTTTNNNITL